MNTDSLITRMYPNSLDNLNVMEESLRRIGEVQFAKDYYQKLYNEAFAKIKAELGRQVEIIQILLTTDDPQELINLIRQFIQSNQLRAELDGELTVNQMPTQGRDRKV